MRDHHPPAETIMELDQVMNLVERIGLPAVIIGFCFYYIMKTHAMNTLLKLFQI